MNPKTKEWRSLSKKQRYEYYVVKKEGNECWDWLGCTDAKGYPRFRFNFTPIFAHRYSYELFIGDIPNGLVIDHLCNNPTCTNPKHLEPKTVYENARRGFKGMTNTMLERGACTRNLHKIKSEKHLLYFPSEKSPRCRKCFLTRFPNYKGKY